MSSQETLRFVFEIQQKGNTAFIKQFIGDIQSGLAKGTTSINQFNTQTASSFNQIQSNVGKTVAIFDSFGNRVSTALRGTVQSFSQLSGMSGALANVGASLKGFTRSLQDVNTFTKTAVTSIGQFDTTVRRNNTTLSQGHTAATRYSAIFKTIEAGIRSTTAAINANSAAIGTNTQRLQQSDTTLRNAIANTQRYQSVLQQENTAITQLAANMDKLTSAQIQAQQAMMSNVRTSLTFFTGFMMLSQSVRDYNLNVEAMADLNLKVEETQRRLTDAIARYGEESYQAGQLRDSLAKAERAVRFEQREMANQIGNQIFMISMVASNIIMELIPALQNWESTSARLRTGMTRFGGAIAGIPTIFAAFARGADRSADAISNIGKHIEPTNRGISILSSNFAATSDRAGKFGKALDAAESAGNRFRAGVTKMVGIIGGAGGGALGAGLIAAGVGLALYSANTNGARDAINEFGVSVGKMHPILKGLGDGLVGIAGSLGLTGETALQTQGHFEDMNGAFHQAGVEWHAMVDSMISDNNFLIQSLGYVAEAIGKFVAGQPLIPEAHMPEVPKDGSGVVFTQKEGTIGNILGDTGQDLQTGKTFPVDPKNLDLSKDITGHAKLYSAFLAKAVEDTEEWNKALDENTFYQEKVRQATANHIATQAQYDQVLDSQKLRQELFTLGIEETETALKANTVELITNTGRLLTYDAALKTVAYQNNLMTEGVQNQRQAFIEEQQEVFRLQGTFTMLGEQIEKQGALEVAYRTGVWETRIALLEREKAIEKQTGVLDAYNNAIVSGQLQELAFAEGINLQREALYKSVEAASNAQGQYMELSRQLEDGIRQATAYEQAYAETVLTIQMGNVEIAAAKGAFNAWVDAAASGELAVQAFQKGIIAQNEVLKQSYEQMQQSAGGLEQFKVQLATGLPQGIAFTQTLIDMGMAARNMEVEFARSAATLMFNQSQFKNSFNDTRDAIIDLNGVVKPTIGTLMQFSAATAKAFTDGRNSVYEWINGMVEAATTTTGAAFETALLSKEIGVVLPSALKGGVAAMQEYIALFLGAPEAISRVRDELQGIFDNIVSGLADAMREGEDELDDAIDKLSEHLGIKFNKGVQEALEFHAGSDLFENLSKEFASLFIGLGKNLDDSSFEGLKNQITGKLESVMDKVLDDIPDGPLKDDIQGIMNEIIGLFNNADVSDMQSPTGITTMMGNLGMKILELTGYTNNFGTIWEAYMTALATRNLAEANRLLNEMSTNMLLLNEVKFDHLTKQFVQVQRAVELTEEAARQLESALEDIQKKYEGMESNNENVRNLAQEVADAYDKQGITDSVAHFPSKDGKIGEFESEQGIHTTPIPISDGADQATIDQAITSLDQLKTKTDEVMQSMLASVANTMGQIATVVNTVTTEIAVAFTTGFTTGAQNAAGMLAMLSAQLNNTISSWNQAILQISTTFTTAFNTGAQNAAGMLAMLSAQLGNSVSAWNGAIQQVAVTMNDTFKRGADDAAGYINELTNHISIKTGEMDGYFLDVAVSMNDNFKRGADDAAGYINNLTNHISTKSGEMISKLADVAEQMAAIGGAAQAAEKDVDSLASAIDALPSEKTITIRINTVGSVPNVARGTMGIINFAEGTGIFGGGRSNNQTVITGESGDEFVRVIDKYGSIREQVVRDIKAFQLKRGESIQVQPLEGYYGKRFQEKFGNIMNMAQGGELPYSINVPAGEGFGISPGAQPNTAMGPILLSPDSRIYLYDGQSRTIQSWNNLSDFQRTTLAESDDVGIKYLPEDYYLHEDYSISPTQQGNYSRYVRNTTWQSGPNAGQPSGIYSDPTQGNNGSNSGGNGPPYPPGSYGGSYIGDRKVLGERDDTYYEMYTGYEVPGYIQSPGHGATSPTKWKNPNHDPRSWRAVPMEDDPKLWKVVDDKGVNIAAKFRSKEEAEEFIQEHIFGLTNVPGEVPPYLNTPNPNVPSNGGTGGNMGGGGTGIGGINNPPTTGGTGGTGSGGTNNGQFPPPAGSSDQSIYDPYNRNLTAGQWGKSYLGGGMWHDPIYKNGGSMMPPPTNGVGGSGGMPQIVTTPDGRVKIVQANGQQSIVIDGKEMLPNSSVQTFSESVNEFSNIIDQQQNSISSTGLSTFSGQNNNVNVQSDFNPNSNVNPLTNSNPIANATSGSVVNQQQQSYSGNGKYYQSQNGVVNTNMTPEEIAALNAKFPFLNLDPSKGVGGSGGGGTGGIGRIFTRNLGLPNLNGVADSTPESIYDGMTVKNDPTGTFPYEMLPDPIFKEIATRSLLPRFGGTGKGKGGDDGGGFDFDWPFNIEKLLKDIFNLLKFQKSNISVKIGEEQILNIIKESIMDGYTNFK